jgi:hypothetical protein
MSHTVASGVCLHTLEVVVLMYSGVSMRNSWKDQYVSSACVSQEHGNCYHVHGGPLPSSPHAGSYLCRCSCHSDCRLRDADPGDISREYCTCPGMIAQHEVTQNSTGSATGPSGKLSTLIEGIQVAREARNQQRQRREAERVVAASAAGKSREEVRSILLAEFARRGLTPPPQPRLDNLVDTYRTEDPVERERLIREGREMFREAVAPLAREVKSLIKPPGN